MQLYAQSYPDEVTGLILLDPSPLAWMMGEGFQELSELFIEASTAFRDDADAASASSDPDARANAGYLNAVASEFEQFFGQTAKEVAAIHSFGKLPLTVIGATEPNPGFGEYAQAYRQFWNAESQRLADKSEAGKFILAEGSSHHIHLDTPQVVLDAVLEMIP
jgi:pimeloyl-ACP methyl ester carboxylesterase